MNRATLMSALRYAIGLGVGGLLLWLAFKDLDFAALVGSLAQVNVAWLMAGLGAMVLAHLLRALRWQQLLDAAGKPVHLGGAFHALMAGYLVNYAVPRLGEVTRCTLLLRNQQVPIATSLGTVVTERLLDVAVLLVLLLALTIGEAQAAETLLGGVRPLLAKVPIWAWVALAAIGAASLWGLWRVWLRYRAEWLERPLLQRVIDFVTNLTQSVLSVRKVKQPEPFLLYTVGIWVCYALNTWFAIRSLPGFEGASLYVGFFLTAVGAIGMSLPVPGGIGSYHALIVFGAVIQGYSRTAGQEAALLMHTSGLIVNVLLGLVGLWMLAGSNRAPEAAKQME